MIFIYIYIYSMYVHVFSMAVCKFFLFFGRNIESLNFTIIIIVWYHSSTTVAPSKTGPLMPFQVLLTKLWESQLPQS